jgi:hypothetical protein
LLFQSVGRLTSNSMLGAAADTDTMTPRTAQNSPFALSAASAATSRADCTTAPDVGRLMALGAIKAPASLAQASWGEPVGDCATAPPAKSAVAAIPKARTAAFISTVLRIVFIFMLIFIWCRPDWNLRDFLTDQPASESPPELPPASKALKVGS